MAGEMSRTERVTAALKGEPVDRVPVSAWWHEWDREWWAEDVAGATLDSYRKYGWDYIKVNPRYTYYGEDWGTAYEAFPDRAPVIRTRAVESAADLTGLTGVNGRDGVFGEQLESLRLIDDGLKGEAPFIQTVFTPLAVMMVMTGSPKFVRKLMQEHPDELASALGEIERTLTEYIVACLETGASGIFLASVEWGTEDNISWEEYERFGRPYDLRMLGAVAEAPFNVYHVCRDRNHLPRLLDYPVAAFHWDAHGAGNLSLAEGLARTDKAVMGGVRQVTMLSGNATTVTSEAAGAIAATGGRRFLLGPGCSIAPETPEANLLALAEAPR
jgi:uroporphyrinogen decarboxylase